MTQRFQLTRQLSVRLSGTQIFERGHNVLKDQLI